MTWKYAEHIMLLRRSDSVWSTLDDAVYELVNPLDWGNGTTLIVNASPLKSRLGDLKPTICRAWIGLVGPSTCESKGE